MKRTIALRWTFLLGVLVAALPFRSASVDQHNYYLWESDHPDEFNILENLPDDVLLQSFSYLDPLDLCRLCTVSKYLQAVAEDEWLWKFILRDVLVPDDDLMPSAPLPKAHKTLTAADAIGLRLPYTLIGPFYHSTSLNLPQHHQRRFAYHQSRGPWWKSVFRRHKTFLYDTSIPIICYRTMSYPPMAHCLRPIRGPIMAVAGWKDIRVVNFRTGSVVTMLKGHTRLITCLSGGNGDDILVSGSEDGTVRVWDTGLTSGEPIVTTILNYPAAIRSLFYEPSSRTVIFGGDSSAIHIHKLGDHAEALSNQPDDVLTSADWSTRVMDYDPRSNRLITIGDNTIQVWSLDDKDWLIRMQVAAPPGSHGSSFYAHSVSDVKFIDSDRFVTAQKGYLTAISSSNGRVLFQISTPNMAEISSLQIVASRYAVCANPTAQAKTCISIFDLEERRLVREMAGHLDGVNQIAIVADHLVTAGAEGMIKVWRAMEDKSPIMKRHETYLRTRSVEQIRQLLGLSNPQELDSSYDYDF